MDNLYCTTCGREYTAGRNEPWRCECGRALDLSKALPSEGPPTSGELNIRDGQWAFDAFIPIKRGVSLGEGFTPEVYSESLGGYFTLEYASPTGSFKDRGTTTMLSRALELDVERVVDDSSGNAGSSVAAYAAHAGLSAEIYVPASAPESKIKTIERVGATVRPIEGSREDVEHACIEAAESGDAWYASHCWRPSFLAGTKTWAFEVAARRDWRVPDAVVLPLGAGTLYIGAYRGFAELADAGWTDGMPRIYGAQAAGYAPIADNLHNEVSGDNAVAGGLHVQNSPRPDEAIKIVGETGGDIIAINQPDTEEALEQLHCDGLYVEPSSAVAPAALEQFRASGAIEEDWDVVVALSGSGLKY